MASEQAVCVKLLVRTPFRWVHRMSLLAPDCRWLRSAVESEWKRSGCRGGRCRVRERVREPIHHRLSGPRFANQLGANHGIEPPHALAKVASLLPLDRLEEATDIADCVMPDPLRVQCLGDSGCQEAAIFIQLSPRVNRCAEPDRDPVALRAISGGDPSPFDPYTQHLIGLPCGSAAFHEFLDRSQLPDHAGKKLSCTHRGVVGTDAAATSAVMTWT